MNGDILQTHKENVSMYVITFSNPQVREIDKRIVEKHLNSFTMGCLVHALYSQFNPCTISASVCTPPVQVVQLPCIYSQCKYFVQLWK